MMYNCIQCVAVWRMNIVCRNIFQIRSNTLRPRQNGRHFADDIFTCIFFNKKCCILFKFSLKYVRKGPIDNNPALVQIMVWRRPGDKPLSEPMMVRLTTHICVTRPQWGKYWSWSLKLVSNAIDWGAIIGPSIYGSKGYQSFSNFQISFLFKQNAIPIHWVSNELDERH